MFGANSQTDETPQLAVIEGLEVGDRTPTLSMTANEPPLEVRLGRPV